MTKPLTAQVDVAGRANGHTTDGKFDWPHFPVLEHASQTIPPLHLPGAWPIARDRWERLVTSIFIPAAPKKVWHALTDPAALKLWLALCHGSLERLDSDCILDFEDGEFFLCRATALDPPNQLQYLWRWLGIGQATAVTWRLEQMEQGTQVTVTEEAVNPPWDWQTWNGGGWPGILEQLAAYLRTGTEWRWPWRRMGPYAQIELPIPFYEAWYQLTNPAGLRYWLQLMDGVLASEQSMTIMMGDASGTVEMTPRVIVEPGQSPPSFLPHIDFTLARPIWNTKVGGRLWMEPAGWGRSLLQVFHYNWENLPAALQLAERKIVTAFWAGAVRRAGLLCGGAQERMGPHSWA